MGGKGVVGAYRLMGEDVSRSPSPAMMNAAFRASGVDAVYEALNVGRSEFPGRFLALRDEISGINLTIPYKTRVIPLLDALDEVSARIGAVNVVARAGERFKGYNTDVNGITAPLRERGMGRIRSALLLGAGGAARAFCEAMNQLGCDEVTVAVRDTAKGDRFSSEMASTFGGLRFSVVAIDRIDGVEADLVFNATPLGGATPLPEPLKRVIYGHATVFDAVYRPMKTELLRTAEEGGSPIICGYEMLLNQGAMAFELWTGKPAPKAVMESALRRALEGER
ncbi:MAG: shikimate dehydrogenase [Nitrososphaerales archaeon]|jgi:shikimate dehydrogenase